MSTTTHRRVALRRCLASAAAVTIGLGGVLVSTTVANAAAPDAPATPIDLSAFDDGRYVVLLDDDAASLYTGGISGLQRTATDGTESLDDADPAVVAYSDYLVTQQDAVATDAGIDTSSISANLTLTTNGFIADLSAEQALELTNDARVASVHPDEILQLQTESPANQYLDVEGMWQQVGGEADAGAGVVVGVLDTGIAPENDLFAGDALSSTPSTEPYLAADGSIVYEKSDGGVFTGTCETGPQFTAEMCNTKIIGAQYFVEGFGVSRLGVAQGLEVVSPRDLDGHGSHTASTAAGNADVEVTTQGGQAIGTMSGVAPSARIAVYKVCWTGPNPDVTTDDGCSGADLMQGIEAATADGVDVINFSIGGGAADSVFAPYDQAFLGAAAAGIFTSASAGNSGPGATTLDHASPWYATVANTTIPNYEATVELEDGSLIPGASISVDMDETATPLEGTLVYAGDIPANGASAANAALCLPGSLADVGPDTIVLCDRGNNARAEKSVVVADAGGVGMILGNPTANSIDLDDHAVPTIHIDAQFYPQVLAAAQADPAQTVTFTPGNSSEFVTPAPIVAASSSRGPVIADGNDVIKPDIAAPGTGIIAAGPNAAGEEQTFAFLSGTSMAAPHVAGLAAIYLSEHPNASVAEIKSALMTTATDTVNPDGSVNQDWFAQGAGFVNTDEFLTPGAYYANGTEDWYGYLRGAGYDLPSSMVGEEIDPSDLNIPSIGIGSLASTQTITRTLTSLEAGTYAVTVDAPDGVTTTVTPQTIDFTAAGQEQTYTVAFETEADAELDVWTTGSLTWTRASDSHTLRSPIAVFPVSVLAPGLAEGTGTTGSLQYDVTPAFTGQIGTSGLGLFPYEEIAGGDEPVGTYAYSEEFAIAEDDLMHAFSLDAADQTADLDLYVYRLNDLGQAVQQFTAATGAASETLLLEGVPAGNYIAEVHVFSAPTPTTSFSLTQSVVTPAGGVGDMTVTPETIDGTVLEPETVEVSWSGLAAETEYLGLVTYSTSENVRTFVHVDSGAIPAPERLGGATRYDVAVAASQLSHPDTAEIVYLASGTVFPDGLSAGPAAAAEDAPLLLTQGDTLTPVTRAEIQRLAPTEIVIVGGPATISPAVQSALSGLADTVTRIGGADRYEVSRNIAERAFPAATTAFLATGGTFPDALTAGAAAGSIDAPVVLVHGTRTSIDAATSTLLSDMGVTDVYVTGGPRSVSQGIVTSLGTAGFDTTRISGADRFEVGINLNEVVFTGDSPLYTGDVTSMFIASGLGFPDALSASALAASSGAPLYVVQSACVPAGVVDARTALGDPTVYLMGGPATLTPAVESFTPCA